MLEWKMPLKQEFYDISYPIEGYGGEMESSDYFLF